MAVLAAMVGMIDIRQDRAYNIAHEAGVLVVATADRKAFAAMRLGPLRSLACYRVF